MACHALYVFVTREEGGSLYTEDPWKAKGRDSHFLQLYFPVKDLSLDVKLDVLHSFLASASRRE